MCIVCVIELQMIVHGYMQIFEIENRSVGICLPALIGCREYLIEYSTLTIIQYILMLMMIDVDISR